MQRIGKAAVLVLAATLGVSGAVHGQETTSHLLLAQKAVADHNWPAALSELQAALMASPDNPSIKFSMALVLEKYGEPKRAADLLKQAIGDGLPEPYRTEAAELMATLSARVKGEAAVFELSGGYRGDNLKASRFGLLSTSLLIDPNGVALIRCTFIQGPNADEILAAGNSSAKTPATIREYDTYVRILPRVADSGSVPMSGEVLPPGRLSTWQTPATGPKRPPRREVEIAPQIAYFQVHQELVRYWIDYPDGTVCNGTFPRMPKDVYEGRPLR